LAVVTAFACRVFRPAGSRRVDSEQAVHRPSSASWPARQASIPRISAIDQHVAGPKERMRRLRRIVRRQSLDARLRLEIQSRVHRQQHRALPSVGRRGAGKLLHKLAHQIETRLAAGSPTTKSGASASRLPSGRKRRGTFRCRAVAANCAAWPLPKRCDSRAKRRRPARPTAAKANRRACCPTCRDRQVPGSNRRDSYPIRAMSSNTTN